MKESPRNIDNNQTSFKQTFNSETDVRANGGVPTLMTFNSNGSVTFPAATNAKIAYANKKVTFKSVIFNLENISSFKCVFNAASSVTISGNTVTATGITGSIVYVNGVAGTAVSVSGKYQVIVTSTANITTSSLFNIGYDGATAYPCTLDLMETKVGTLTVDEITNLYNKRENRVLTNTTTITCVFDYNSLYSKSFDRIGNTMTETAMTYPQCGARTSAYFDKSTSKIVLGTDIVGTNIIADVFWVGLANVSTDHKIKGNDKYIVEFETANKRIRVRRDAGLNYANSANSSITKAGWYCIGIFSSATGTTIYIGDVRTPMTLSSTANQSAGALTAGAAQELGHNNDGYMKGNLPLDRIDVYASHDLVTALLRFENYRSSTRKYYN